MHILWLFSKWYESKVETQYIDSLVSELKLASERPRLKRRLNPCLIYRWRYNQHRYLHQTPERLLKAIKEYLPLVTITSLP